MVLCEIFGVILLATSNTIFVDLTEVVIAGAPEDEYAVDAKVLVWYCNGLKTNAGPTVVSELVPSL